jgi:hypothetical protein
MSGTASKVAGIYLRPTTITKSTQYVRYKVLSAVLLESAHIINTFTSELNPSAQRCRTRFFAGYFTPWTVHFVSICVKNKKRNNYSFSLLIIYGSSYMFRHYIARFTPIHNIILTAPQLSISQKALGTLPEDGNVTPKHVGATIHN